MFVYSNRIIRFVEEIKRTIREILSQEVGLKVRGDRFYDKKGQFSYPIKVVIYNYKSMLGYFDPHFYEMGFHEKLMYVDPKQLGSIIRHEIAHYLTFIAHGEGVPAHGEVFRAVCQQLGWGEEVFRATICLEEALEEKGESVLCRKVRKLFALAQSSNPHEAEAAMLKSRQLLLKYNMEEYVAREEEEHVVLKRILKQKKEDAKMRAIAHILETFFVSVVFNRGGDGIYLEILGSPVHVEIADYVATVLNSQLERLWKTSCLKGLTAKNSFFLGIATGYCKKVQSLKKEHGQTEETALLVLEKQLLDAKAMVYPRLVTTQRRGKHCCTSSALGEKIGRELKINAALSSTTATTFLIQLLAK